MGNVTGGEVVLMTGSEAGSALVGVLVVVSLVCFVLYCWLGPAASFADGMVPLVAVGIESVVLVALLLR